MTFDDIKTLHEQGSLRDLDYFLAEMLSRRYNNATPEILLTAAITSHNMIDSHICLDLNEMAGKEWPKQSADDYEASPFKIKLPSKDKWIELLNSSELCCAENSDSAEISPTPLVLVDSRVYLHRYFSYEKLVAEKLLELATPKDNKGQPTVSSDDNNKLLNILFPTNNTKQIAAAKVILENRLLIISGGPGTGKTYTLARLIALLAAASGDESPVIRMAAPTGKAAMRMRESIRNAKEDIKAALKNDSNLQKIADIPENACTLHRLLGTISNSTKFRYNAENPLPADILIIDEASMIDLPMMAKLLSALQENTKLILLGDMHQLSSVEPGSVMGDICQAAQNAQNSHLGRSLVELTFSHRFDADSPIGLLSSSLQAAGSSSDPKGDNAWDTLNNLSHLKHDKHRVLLHETPEKLSDDKNQPIDDFREAIWKNHKNLLDATTVEEAFRAVSDFRVFSPLRKGPHGVQTINKLIEDTLASKNPEHKDTRPLNTVEEFYNRRVVIIKSNDYGLKLFNGDIGIVMNEDANGSAENTPPKKVVWFESSTEESSEKCYRSFSCNMIPEHETAFAMTIHKSQGSEYKKVMVIMPHRDNEHLFTKELLYTAITRAQEEVNLWCNENIFKATACRKAECTSGLVEQLEQDH